MDDKNKCVLREILKVDEDVVGNGSCDFRKLFGQELFVYMQSGHIGVIFYYTRNILYNIFYIAAVRIEGFIHAHRLSKHHTADDASRQYDDYSDHQKNNGSSRTGIMQFPVEIFVKRTEDTGNDSRPENRKKERRKQIEKQKEDNDHYREKKYVLDS